MKSPFQLGWAIKRPSWSVWCHLFWLHSNRLVRSLLLFYIIYYIACYILLWCIFGAICSSHLRHFQAALINKVLLIVDEVTICEMQEWSPTENHYTALSFGFGMLLNSGQSQLLQIHEILETKRKAKRKANDVPWFIGLQDLQLQITADVAQCLLGVYSDKWVLKSSVIKDPLWWKSWYSCCSHVPLAVFCC